MRLTKDIERPELTDRKYKAINTCYYNSPAACANKLGEYEDIDESPEHLAKVKRAFDIIKEKGIDIIALKECRKAKTYNENTKRTYCEEYTEEEFNLLKEV